MPGRNMRERVRPSAWATESATSASVTNSHNSGPGAGHQWTPKLAVTFSQTPKSKYSMRRRSLGRGSRRAGCCIVTTEKRW